MTIQDKFATIPDSARISICWPNAEFICEAGEIKRAMWVCYDPTTLARLFHDTYERLAPEFGYATRDDTKQFDPTSANGRLMRAVVQEVMTVSTAPEVEVRDVGSAVGVTSEQSPVVRQPLDLIFYTVDYVDGKEALIQHHKDEPEGFDLLQSHPEVPACAYLDFVSRGNRITLALTKQWLLQALKTAEPVNIFGPTR